MKKTTALLFAALLAFVPLSAQATTEEQIEDFIVEQIEEQVEEQVQEKALVIVDAYFESSKISGNIVDICIARVGCELTPTPVSGVSSAYNHGTAMADIARKANPDATLYLVRAASSFKNPRTGQVTMNGVNGNDFLNALKLVESRKDEIAAVSFSYSMNGNMTRPGECRLSSSGLVNVSVVDPQIRSTISQLKNSGIPVFAATGNDRNRKPVSYPACISDVMSVASGVGDSFLTSSNHDANTDYVGALPSNVFSYTSTIFRNIPHATSSATASVASMWVDGLVTEKWVRLSR
jgi:hypothetical protein